MEPRRRNPLRRYPTAVCISVLHFGLAGAQDKSVEWPCISPEPSSLGDWGRANPLTAAVINARQ